MKPALIGAALTAMLLLSACTISSQYPQILQTTMAQSLPPYHSAESTQK